VASYKLLMWWFLIKTAG